MLEFHCFLRGNALQLVHAKTIVFNWTEECATKRVFGEITLLITNYLILLQV